MATTVKAPSKPVAVPDTAPQRQREKPADSNLDSSKSDAKGAKGAKSSQLDPATTRSLLLILHGKRVEDDLVKNAIADLKKEGHKISVRVTFGRGDVEQFVEEAVRLNGQGVTKYETFVAGGGDGTLNEVVCALMTHRDEMQRQGISVGLLPLGTANDFACVCGISVDPYVALSTALDPSTIHSIDVAAVNGQPFMNTAVAGSLAETSAEELDGKWKRLLGPVAIGFHVLKRMLQPASLQPHKEVKITFCSEPGAPPPSDMRQSDPGKYNSASGKAGGNHSDKVRTLTADLLMLAAGNSRQMGRRVNVCPDALLDDGLLDFTLMTGSDFRAEAAGIVGALTFGGPDHVACEQGIAQLKGSWLEVQVSASSEEKMPVNRDGEPEVSSARLLFEVYPKALQFHLPDDRMLQSHVSLDSAASTESVLSEGDIRGIVISEGATTEAPAGDGGKKHKHHGIFSKKPKHRKLRKRTLRRMVVAVQPEGWEVRRRANLVKAAKKLGKWSAVLLVGASLGWLVGEGKRRRGSSRQHVLARSHSNKKQEHGKLNKSSVGAAFEKARHAVGHV